MFRDILTALSIPSELKRDFFRDFENSFIVCQNISSTASSKNSSIGLPDLNHIAIYNMITITIDILVRD